MAEFVNVEVRDITYTFKITGTEAKALAKAMTFASSHINDLGLDQQSKDLFVDVLRALTVRLQGDGLI